MHLRRGEQEPTTLPEPQVFGVQIDPASADLYAEFAEGRSLDEVYAVWKDPEVTNPTIRQRATAVLTAPHGYKLPFPHSDQSIGRLVNIKEDVDGKQTNSLRERMKNRPELAEELAEGIEYWLDQTAGRIPEPSLESRYYYNEMIVNLLPIVEEDTADKLFAQYPINFLDSTNTLDATFGYGLPLRLIEDKEIPQKYKNIVMTKLFEAAEKEKHITIDPWTELKFATRSMADFVQSWTYGENVEDDVHTKIVSLLEDCTPTGNTYVWGHAVTRVADHIADNDVLFSFVNRHIIIGQEEELGRFRIENARDLQLVKWAKREAQKRELSQLDTTKIDALVQDYDTQRKERLAQQAAEIALQSRLRA